MTDLLVSSETSLEASLLEIMRSGDDDFANRTSRNKSMRKVANLIANALEVSAYVSRVSMQAHISGDYIDKAVDPVSAGCLDDIVPRFRVTELRDILSLATHLLKRRRYQVEKGDLNFSPDFMGMHFAGQQLLF